jgi:hypothetical protein
VTVTSYVNDITVEYRLVAITCADCGISFGIGKAFQDARRADQRGFYCPNGHSNYYPKPKRTEADRLREQLDAARSLASRERERREAADRSARACKGVATRVKRQAAHGVCPAPGCKRSFANLAAHMAGQHPDFVAEHPAGGAR